MHDFFPGFAERRIETSGATINLVTGGSGPPLLLLHGYPQTHVMWRKVAPRLAEHFTVVVPDLRGMGLSPQPKTGYDKKNQAHDIAQVLDRLKVDSTALVTHDIGTMVGYAFAARFPARILITFAEANRPESKLHPE